MTSNLGTSSDARGTFGFVTSRASTEGERAKLRENVEDALRRFFRPEFLNRIDEVIIFEPLTERELDQIVELMLDDVAGRLEDRSVTFEVTAAAKQALVKEGYDPAYGARPLRRVVERQVENGLARRILSGEFDEGDVVRVDYAGDEGYTFEKASAPAGAKATA
jgi:ATP-dependent Clp protease ATP-binding subunit ClpA